MKKVILVLFVAFALSSCVEKSEGVYIALQPPTKYYHRKPLCKYLLKARIEEIKKVEALRYGKIPCRYCYSQYDVDEFNGNLDYMKDIGKDDEDEDEYYFEGSDTLLVDTMAAE